MRARPNLNEAQLAIVVAQAYRLHDVQLTFFPAGHDGFAYRVTSQQGTYHLKVYRQKLAWDAVFKIPALLQQKFGLKGVVAPIETFSGAYHVAVGGYQIALFPFIDALSMAANPFNYAQLHEVGRLLAMIHGLTSRLTNRGIDIPREQYDMPHSARFKRVMEALSTAAESSSEAHRKLAGMLKPLEARLWAEHADYERAAGACKAESEPLVLCHGDPTAGNILGGQIVYFIDWDGVMLAPKERDLVSFEGDPFYASVLDAYGIYPLNATALKYYRLMWNIQEIADFGSNILFEGNSTAKTGETSQSVTSDAQNAHDLAELQRFLEYSGLNQG